MSIQASRSWRWRAMLLALLGLLLVWQVVTRSLAAYLADAAPEAALRLDAAHPVALLALAGRKLNESQAASDAKQQVAGGPDQIGAETPAASPDASDLMVLLPRHAFEALRDSPSFGQPAGTNVPAAAPEASRAPGPDPESRKEIRAMTELALLSDPLNARALRILGQLALGASDEERTERLMKAAASRSLRESVAVYWLMQKSYERKDYGTTLFYADVLFRTRPQVAQQVTPVLARMAEDKDASAELKKLLASNPPWRWMFFYYLNSSISDARTPLDLLLSLKDSSTPPTAADLGGYLNFLIGKNFHELAYYTWLQFLPAEQLSSAGLLFNGSFEVAPSGLPFDWVIAKGSGVTVDRAVLPDSDGQHGLAIEFGHGRVEFRPVTQMTMLAPGAYQLTGKYQGQISGRRGMVWRFACASGGGPIAETAMILGIAPKWKDFELSFTVPATGCRAQSVRLELDARSASEQMVSGSILFDELKISRANM